MIFLNFHEFFSPPPLTQGIFAGVQSLHTFMETTCPANLKRHYHGMVLNMFTCNAQLYAPLSVIFNEFLFYHIVDSAATATQIINRYNAANFNGIINFIALDVVQVAAPDKPLPPFLNHLTFDEKYHKVFQLICEQIPETDQLDAIHNVNDLFDANTMIYVRDGAFSSIELTASGKLLQLYHRYVEFQGEIAALSGEITENRQNFDVVDGELKQSLTDLKQCKERGESIKQEQNAVLLIKQQISVAEKKIEAKEGTLSRHKNRLHEFNQSMERLKRELEQPFITDAESNAIETLDNEIGEIVMTNDRVLLEIRTFQSEQQHLQNHMQTNLLRRHDELDENLSVYSKKSTECSVREMEIEQLTKQLDESNSDQTTIDSQLEELKNAIVTLNKEIDDIKKKKIAAQGNQQQYMKEQTDLECHKKSLSDQLKRLISQAANGRMAISQTDFSGLTGSDMDHELKLARQHVDSYKKTNRFDDGLLATFRQEKVRLEGRRDELNHCGDRIEKAILEYDAKIQQVMGDTLDDLKARFGELFPAFVENGTADMEILSEKLHEESGTKDYAVGLDISAKFAVNEMNFEKLSLAERRIVALVFILTIQQLSGVPFFLFDCIDRVSLDISSVLWSFYSRFRRKLFKFQLEHGDSTRTLENSYKKHSQKIPLTSRSYPSHIIVNGLIIWIN